MTTDERKILRELRNKNANEVAWNILEDRRRKELEKVLSETDNLTEQEQLYLDCQNQNRTTLLISVLTMLNGSILRISLRLLE